jgi:predicted permease
MNDFKFAFRSLLRTPGFTLIAVLTIAVGIGANTALFSAFDRLILHPTTFPQPSSLVAIWAINHNANFVAPAVSWTRYEEISAHISSFSSVANSAFDNFTLTGNGEPDQLNGLRVTPGFFPTLGVPLLAGRNFTADEDKPNGPAVCIISHEVWLTRFGGRPGLVGENIQLNGQPWQVVGILPPHLSNPFNAVQVFAPRVFAVSGLTPVQVQVGAGYSQPIARLKPGVTLARANEELAALSKHYGELYPAKLDAPNLSEARDYNAALTGNLRPTFFTLLGAVGFVLLIACANVTSLFLGRLATRHKEIAVRQSLGAARSQIVRQFLIESLVFSTAAGGLGVLFALWSLKSIETVVVSQLPAGTTLTLDWTALGFTACVTLFSGLLVGLVPAVQASKTGLVEVLKDSARGSSGARGGKFRSTIIVGQVALSIVLLVGSTLLLLSFIRLQRTPPGFDPHGIASAFVGIPINRYKTKPEQAAFFNQVAERLRASPLVTGAAIALGLPLNGFNAQAPYSVDGRPILPLSQRPLANFQVVNEDYFRTLRIPLRAGREFNAQDRNGGPGVCIINEALAKRLFPGESAVGKVLMRGRDAELKHEIVGVIGDLKSNGLNAPVPDEVYYPLAQIGQSGMSVIARTDGDPNALQAVIKSAVAAVDPAQPISFFQTLETGLALSLGVQRIVASLTAVFAGLALVLAAVGLYSVLAYNVTQRTAEIGIRMALGAQRRQVVSMILNGGMKLVGLGVVIGLVAAAGTARLIQALLFSVEPLDPLVYGAVAALFAVVAALACLIPSLRASRVDPLIALRNE